MQIFKDISPDDYNITPFITNKEWTFDSSSYTDYVSGSWGIQVSEGIKDSIGINADSASKNSIYNLVNTLYYRYENGDYNNYSAYDTLTSLNLANSLWLFSIPQQIIGDRIEPRSVELTSGSSWDIHDDGHGNLYDYENIDEGIIGNVFYEQGNIILTHTASYCGANFNSGSNWELKLRGSHIIYEHEAICNIKENEFCMTTNRTAYTSSVSTSSRVSMIVIPALSLITFGDLEFTVAAEETLENIFSLPDNKVLYDENWDPYITTIGLYNNDYELLAIGKLASPIQNKKNEELTFIIQWDL